jgi:hypothetical protein
LNTDKICESAFIAAVPHRQGLSTVPYPAIKIKPQQIKKFFKKCVDSQADLIYNNSSILQGWDYLAFSSPSAPNPVFFMRPRTPCKRVKNWATIVEDNDREGEDTHKCCRAPAENSRSNTQFHLQTPRFIIKWRYAEIPQ